MRIIFMGTPAFAVPTLLKLHDSGFTIPAVITAPDKLGGRGKKEWLISAVKETALTLNIPVLQPTNLKNDSFLQTVNDLKPDLFIVVAFRMLPEVLWNLPPLGTINLHASILPDYRGAAPINWAIINGETTTGVTTFFIRKDIDTGPIILTKSIEILPEDNVGSLHDRLMLVGANLVIDSLKSILDPTYVSFPQVKGSTKTAPKLQHETGKIDLSKSTVEVTNLIRGLSPYPGAWLTTKLGEIKILSAKVIETSVDFMGKHYLSDNKTFIYLKTRDHYISLDKFQIPGKKPIDVKSYLNGNKADTWF
ncbi:MAG: methionyl-tRNA formyltransferase [Saprospiraceae bacterium]|jgi:methionyl-tRNA formyltransferase